MNINTTEKYQFNCPYLSLNKKTIIENKEELLSNLFFHILPYIAAANEQELKQYKALVSFNLMDVCLENYCDICPLARLKRQCQAFLNIV